MRLVKIDIKSEPACLKELRTNNCTYSDLKDECIKEVRKIIDEFQQGYCAYCEQKFKPTTIIEHFIPQSVDDTKVLDFDNFLGVCSGKNYLDKKSGDHIEHCGNSRKNKLLNINPKIQEHIAAIYYDPDGTIRSTIDSHERDLNLTLNLNFEILKQKRNIEFKINLANLIFISQLKNLNKNEAYTIALKAAISGKFQFSGYLTFRYRRLLNNNAN